MLLTPFFYDFPCTRRYSRH